MSGEDASPGASEGRPAVDDEVKVEHRDGQRFVSWSVSTRDGAMQVKHDLPDALGSYYAVGGLNDDILLYRGPFHFRGDTAGRPWDGDVRFTWRPTQRVTARGERETAFEDLANLGRSEETWIAAPLVDLPGPSVPLPQPPKHSAPPWSRKARTSHRGDNSLGDQRLGEPHGLDQLTFLVPNGWESLDGYNVCDPADLRRYWAARTPCEAAGWSIALDRIYGRDNGFWRELKADGGHAITHVGQVCRVDGARFDAEDALPVLDAVRIALSIFLGRTSQCLLPVGYRDGQAVWARWATGSVDPFRTVGSWRDTSIACAQLSELLARVVERCQDRQQRDVLRYASSYYVTANFDVDVELGVAVPVSGLQLLAYSRFVEEGRSYSRNEWKALNTETQLRALLDDCQVDLTIPTHFQHLHDVAAALLARSGQQRDGLGCVISMRNDITHPTRERTTRWSVYQWAEAGMFARHLLELALLNIVGYSGKYHSRVDPNRWLGAVQDVPWRPSSGAVDAASTAQK